MTVETDLILQAARLARSAPQEWDRFLVAFRNYSDNTTDQCIKSTLDELPRSQGRAQNAARLYGLLSECLKSADKIEGKSR